MELHEQTQILLPSRQAEVIEVENGAHNEAEERQPSNSVLNLPLKQSWRQLRATKELSRNCERGTINRLRSREPSIIFRNSPETLENQGQVEKPVRTS